MSEIKKKPIELLEGVEYIAKAGDVVITDEHSIADVVRYAISCTNGDKSEIQFILDGE